MPCTKIKEDKHKNQARKSHAGPPKKKMRPGLPGLPGLFEFLASPLAKRGVTLFARAVSLSELSRVFFRYAILVTNPIRTRDQPYYRGHQPYQPHYQGYHQPYYQGYIRVSLSCSLRPQRSSLQNASARKPGVLDVHGWKYQFSNVKNTPQTHTCQAKTFTPEGP